MSSSGFVSLLIFIPLCFLFYLGITLNNQIFAACMPFPFSVIVSFCPLWFDNGDLIIDSEMIAGDLMY